MRSSAAATRSSLSSARIDVLAHLGKNSALGDALILDFALDRRLRGLERARHELLLLCEAAGEMVGDEAEDAALRELALGHALNRTYQLR